MNEKQVKKWTVASIIFCYVFMMLPVILSKLNTWIWSGDLEQVIFVTMEDTIEKVMFSILFLSLLILLIYSDNVMYWFEKKTKIGKWISTPVRGYYKYYNK